MSFTFEEMRTALREHFKPDDFRGLQEDAIRAVLEGRDFLLTMPTGVGDFRRRTVNPGRQRVEKLEESGYSYASSYAAASTAS